MASHIQKPKNIKHINLTNLFNRPNYVKKQASKIRFAIALETINIRGFLAVFSYGLFFSTFWIYGLISPERARIIKSGYFWLRHIDDIADRDKPLPEGYRSRRAFLKRRKSIVEKLSSGRVIVLGDRVDMLLVDYMIASQKLGIDLTKESIAIVEALMIDEQRSRTKRILTQQELDDYFEKLDFSCVDGALKVAGDFWASKYLRDLSMAVRTRFNLKDFLSDLQSGIINISAEDMERYGIDLSKCETGNVKQLLEYPPIKRWYKDQIKSGFGFLERTRTTLKKIPLKWQTQLALSVNFVNPTALTFRRYQKLLK